MRRKRSMQGEIVEVEGGRIIRALARKDRHSKVCTAKGPKDRRVRLSATTAIRFYDVQDRLGYDRPSLAIDWLMNEAKPAIDALNGGDHLVPAIKSNTPSNIALSHYFHQTSQELEGYYSVPDNKGNLVLQELPLCVGSRGGSIPYGFNISENGIENQQQNVSEFQTSCFDSFFNNYPESLNSRNMGLFSAKTTLEEGREETVQFQRMVTWNSVPSSSNVKESVQEYDIDFSLQWHLRHFSDQNHALFTQREPLQSSYLPSVQGSVPALNTSFGIGFANDGLMGFSFPACIGGQEEKQENLVSEELFSASSLLHYQD